jgi:hypothetical protein
MITYRVNASKVPRISLITLGKKAPCTHWLGGFMTHSHSRGDCKTKIPVPIGNGIQPIAYH